MHMTCVKGSRSDRKLAKHLHTSFVFDIQLNNSRSGFDLDMVVISKQRFFNIVLPV